MSAPDPDPAPDRPDTGRPLFERARGGDGRAVSELVERYLPSLRAYVRLRHDPSLAARESSSDVVQSVCRELLVNLDAIEWRGESAFRAWLYTAVRRKLADRAAYLRAARRDIGREEPAAADDADDSRLLACYAALGSPSGDAMGRELLARMEAAFARLPADYREVIVLSRIVGLDRAAVAEHMGRSAASVRNLLARGLARLAEELEPG